AVLALERVGVTNKKVVPALVKAVRDDKNDRVRSSAARAVGRLVAKIIANAREDKEEVPKFDNAISTLKEVLRSKAADKVRESAAIALGTIGPDARAAASDLSLTLKDKNADVVTASAVALRRMGEAAKDAASDLTTLLSNKKAPTLARTEAALALAL